MPVPTRPTRFRAPRPPDPAAGSTRADTTSPSHVDRSGAGGRPASGGRSGVDRSRRAAALLLVLVLVAVAASITIGARPVGPAAVWHALTGPTGTEADIVIRSLRLPRTALGVLVGVALGVAGALAQGHTRNPLADPGLLGVTAGAALAVVTGIFVLGVATLSGYIWFAFAGALIASAVVFGLGTLGRAAATPLTLALTGAAVTALLGGFTTAIVLSDQQTLDSYRFWTVGSLAGRPADVTSQVLPFVAVGLLLAIGNAPALNALSLGVDVARGVGVRTGPARAVGVVAITLLTGAAVAACGPIGFVGLVAPHAARAVTGPDHRWLLVVSGLLGAVLVLTADVVGRIVTGAGELPVGIVLGLIGAPFFVALVRRKQLVRL